MSAAEGAVLAALQGHVPPEGPDAWPPPRTLDVYVSSAHREFVEERRQLLEVVGVELAGAYEEARVEVALVDAQFGGDGGDDGNPALLRHHLRRLRHAHTHSKAGYFLCFLGGDASHYTPVLPSTIEEELFEKIVESVDGAEEGPSYLRACYERRGDGYYHLRDEDQWFNNLVEREPQRTELARVQCALSTGVLRVLPHPRAAHLLRSKLEIECELALELLDSGKHPQGMIAVLRELMPPPEEAGQGQGLELEVGVDRLAYQRLQTLRDTILARLPQQNLILLEEDEGGARCGQEAQLAEYRERLLRALSALLDDSLSGEPDHGKGRKKTVQEIFLEHITHMRICIEHHGLYKITLETLQKVADDILSDFKEQYSSRSRHAPVLVHGPDGVGKTTLLTHLYFHCETVFPKPVLRVIRFSAATPRSAYNLELLRVLCQQISIILKIPEGYLPKDASFDPLYINNWFQSLLRRCEDMEEEILVLLFDNVHKVNPLECDMVTGLSWLPTTLPHNVFLVCTSGAPLHQLQLTPAQKDKLSTSRAHYELPSDSSHVAPDVDAVFDNMERVFGVAAFSKLAGYVTCSEFGLSELELLELLMPTANSAALISLAQANYTFSTLAVARHMLGEQVVEVVVSGRVAWRWRWGGAAAAARRRYVRAQSTLRAAHSDLAALHFAHLAHHDDDSDTEREGSAGGRERGSGSDEEEDPTPFHSGRAGAGAAAAFTQRHVEESWLHLLLAGDFAKLKDLTVCNFDFLLAAVQTVTISYLRCILEHVRCYILDRDVELVYGAVRKASDILTRDPMQLASQIIAWLRMGVARRDVMRALVGAAMAWCDGYDKPLLVPLNGWLQPPIASVVRVMVAGGVGGAAAGGATGAAGGGSIRLLQLAPSGQHLLLAPTSGDPQLWHIMSNSRVHTFKGHSGRVTCMCVSRESQYLLTGSEDTTVAVWDLHTLTLKFKIVEHIAPVLCVGVVLSKSLVVSGGEDSALILTSLLDGTLVKKLDHHRGPVTGLKVVEEEGDGGGGVVSSCSLDGTVASWRLDTLAPLGSVHCGAPLLAMDVTPDAVFLVTLQAPGAVPAAAATGAGAAAADPGDATLHLRAFVTGTYLHALKRHKAKVRSWCVARDSARLAVGCADQRVYLYSLHSGALLRALPVAHDPAALTVTPHDHFLLVAGGNRVTIYSFHTEDNLTNFLPTKQVKRRPTKSTTSLSLLQAEQSELIPISCLEVSMDGQLAASGCARGLVRVWQLSAHRLQATLAGHLGLVSCLAFAPSSLVVLSGSEDRSVVVWQLPTHSSSLTYRGHGSALASVAAAADGRRAVSAERAGRVHVWLLDSGILLQSATTTATSSPTPAHLALTLNMKFAVVWEGGNSVTIWRLSGGEGEGGEGEGGEDGGRRAVSHGARVTCFALTADCQHVVTGSEDMSLKVWQLDGGKLSQVLVGHAGAVLCVAVSLGQRAQAVSGAADCNLLVWDLNTGADLHLLSGHLASVTCLSLTADGTIALSGSEDHTLIVWETKRGLALTSLALHVPLLGLRISCDCARIVVHLADRGCLPIICLHNTPATYVKVPTYAAPTKTLDELRPLMAKRPMKRLLKKEVSLDTYTWQKKYGHLTSAAMMAQVDERLKRRFSVSASMEEISKIQQEKNKDLGSLASLGPEQAALAQSQHFDQLEALWSKVPPPHAPRRMHPRPPNKSMPRQSSLIESRLDSSDEEHTPLDEKEHIVE